MESFNDRTLIVGDFNLSNIEWTPKTESTSLKGLNTGSKLGQKLLDFFALNGLKQYNNIVNNRDKILDLVPN